MIATYADKIISARTNLVENLPASSRASEAAEGGCGVLGLAANVAIPGRHTMTAAAQMNNRGNGKSPYWTPPPARKLKPNSSPLILILPRPTKYPI